MELEAGATVCNLSQSDLILPGNSPEELEPNPGQGERRGNLQSRRISLELAKRIGPQKFDMWFAHTTLRIDGQRLEVATDSPFVASWIDTNFAADLREAAEQTLGRSMQVEVRVAASTVSDASPEMNASRSDQADSNAAQDGRHGKSSAATPHRAKSRHGESDSRRVDDDGPHHRSDRTTRPPRRGQSLRRLSDFIVGSSNKLAFSTARRLAEDADARCISPLFIHGDCGVGKTHLLQGVCQRFQELAGRPPQVRYVTGEQFTNEYIASIRGNNIDSFRQRIRKLDLLAIDDVHFLSNKVRTQTEFLYTLDAIDLSGARVVMASDNHPHHIKKFSQALVSRFLSGMVVKIDRPDRATRIELINRLAAARGLRMNAAAIDAIAANCVGSVRELEGAITKLAAYHVLLNGGHNGNHHASNGNHANPEIGLVLVEQLFREQAVQPNHIVRMATVIEVVCERLVVNKADLLASGRHRRVVLARSLVVYLGREMTTQSFPEIAHALGRANHSTVHTADQRLRKQIPQDEMVDLGGESRISLKELIDQLRRDVADRAAKRP